jgi:hypothetical protein
MMRFHAFSDKDSTALLPRYFLSTQRRKATKAQKDFTDRQGRRIKNRQKAHPNTLKRELQRRTKLKNIGVPGWSSRFSVFGCAFKMRLPCTHCFAPCSNTGQSPILENIFHG